VVREAQNIEFLQWYSLIYLKWGAFYLFIADFFATQNIGGAKELVVLL